MSRTKRFLIALGLTIWVVAARGCVVWDGPYEGYVRDKATGKPLEGAVVAAFWYRYVPTPPVHGLTLFFEAQESVTDEHGMFRIRGQRWLNLVPFSIVEEPLFTVYALGYSPCAGLSANAEGDCGQPTVRLQKRNSAEGPDWPHYNLGAHNDPQDWVPRLLEVMQKDKNSYGANNPSHGGSPPWSPPDS